MTSCTISDGDIKAAVDALFDEQVKFLQQLVRFPSTRGNEAAIQQFLAETMRDMGLDVDHFKINPDDISSHEGFSPITVSYDDMWNVVGTHNPKSTEEGKSLILNGHVDVVPTGDPKRWRFGPFNPVIKDGYMYGRGAHDMKSGVSANIFALKALQKLGFMPKGRVHLETVVEEECTGNGALACLVRGYTADTAVVTEPSGFKLIRSQTGPIWVRVDVQGAPAHASGLTGKTADAIHNAMALIHSLDALEEAMNAKKGQFPPFDKHPHPINFNVGLIQGGEWTSSMPSLCWFQVRIAVYPNQDPKEVCREFENHVKEFCESHPFLKDNLPKISYPAFMTTGYTLENAKEQEDILKECHAQVRGEELQELLFPATTDARFTGLYGNCPSLIYGPYGHNPHAFDECVEVESVRQVTQIIALFIAKWCGLEKIEN